MNILILLWSALATVIILLLIREINNWYWKVNERIQLLKEIKEELKKINRAKYHDK